MSGWWWLARRLGSASVTVLVGLTLSFVIFRAAPGDVTDRLARNPDFSAAERMALRDRLGLDEGLVGQYWAYLKALFHGDLGLSYTTNTSVSGRLVQALELTLPLVVAGTVIGFALGILAGLIAAARHGRWQDNAVLGLATSAFALPAQWLGLMGILLFSGVLPSGGRIDPFLTNPSWITHTLDVAKHMLLPGAILAISSFGSYALIVRSAILETLGEDYIVTARAKGLSNGQVLRRHALRNAMLPTVSLFGLSLGFIVSGALLVETVFSWPGLGTLTYEAVTQRDYPILQGAFLLLTVSVVICNLLADLALYWLDPRIRTS